MFWQHLINGVSVGSIYALIAIGYNMVYGILELLNFAHGDVYAVGCFAALSLLMAGWNPILAGLAGLVLACLINLAVERFAYRPVRFSGRITPTISAVGIAYIMRNVVLRVWGPEARPFNFYKSTPIEVGGVIFGTVQVYTLAVAVLLMLAFTFYLKRTRNGQAITAISQSIPTAMLMGIRVNTAIALVYALGAGLGVIGGFMFGFYYESIFMGMGFMLGTMKAWMASIFGGIGSLKGALIGAIILGITENMAAAYISTQYRDAVVWGFFMLFMLIRPGGLFPAQISEKV